MAKQILPLPHPLGLDSSTLIHTPVRLHIKPGHLQAHTQITDDFGRELVVWQKSSYSLSKRRAFYTPDGRHLYDLRAHGSSVLQGCLMGGAKGWYFESGGQEIGWIEPDSMDRNAGWEMGFTNMAGGREQVVLRMRGRVGEGGAALMLGNMPVVLFYRATMHGVGFNGFYSYSYNQAAPTYEALVAPGCDLVWIASFISALEIASVDNR